MWVFTKYGFYAAANARVEDRPDAPPDLNRIAIRTRHRQHLLNLQQRFHFLSEYPIHEDPKADYQYRMFVPKPVWSIVTHELAGEMNYDRFKPAVEHFPGYEDYKSMLLEVWHVGYRHREGS